jgi:hypothetical protein
MKTKAFLTLAALFILAVSAVAAPAPDSRDDDMQAIKKAVKENPAYEAGREVKWFKVLVTDTKTNKEKVKITLPIALVEAFVKCTDDKHLRLRDQGCDIDFGVLLAELKKVGPMAIVEVIDDDELIKVWFE